MTNHSRAVVPAVALLALVAACASDDSDLDPGGSTVAGNVAAASTNGDTSLANIAVEVRGDRSATAVTDSAGNFVVFEAPTGEIEVVLRRGACEAIRELDTVPSRSNLDFVDVFFDCTDFDFALVLESFEAVLREEPFSRDDTLRTCARIGGRDRTRDVDGETATIIDDDDDIGSFSDLSEDDLLLIEGDRDASGRSATFIAENIRILDRDARDPCN